MYRKPDYSLIQVYATVAHKPQYHFFLYYLINVYSFILHKF